MSHLTKGFKFLKEIINLVFIQLTVFSWGEKQWLDQYRNLHRSDGPCAVGPGPGKPEDGADLMSLMWMDQNARKRS